jgi:transcriptional regulator with XRE-family HTH domain
MSASSLLRLARHQRGASQRTLARLANVSQPGIAAVESGAHDTTVSRLEQLLAALNQQIILLPSYCGPVWEAAAHIRIALQEVGPGDRAFRRVIQLSDDLAREGGAVRVALAVTEPAPIGDIRWDALVAGVVDYWLTVDNLPRPDWLDDPRFTLSDPWTLEPVPSLQDDARRRTPTAIRRHGVFLAKSELESV